MKMAILPLLMGLAIHGSVFAYDFFYWDHGTTGHESALYGAELSEKPLILYFHVQKCRWCEELNDSYLAKEEVEDFLLEMYKVEINPERGEDEIALTSEYGIKRYPAFLVSIPGFEVEPQRVHPFAKDQAMSVEEFLQTIKERIAHIYSAKAYKFFKSNDYETSLKYYQLALDSDPENLYVLHAMGIIHERIGIEKRNLESFLDAEEKFIEALEIDPTHKDSQAALENVQKNIKILKEN